MTCSIHLQTIANINFSQFWRVLIIPYGQSYSVEVYLSSKEFKLGSQILTFAVLHFSFFESVLILRAEFMFFFKTTMTKCQHKKILCTISLSGSYILPKFPIL